jgi:hypothetical protein
MTYTLLLILGSSMATIPGFNTRLQCAMSVENLADMESLRYQCIEIPAPKPIIAEVKKSCKNNEMCDVVIVNDAPKEPCVCPQFKPGTSTTPFTVNSPEMIMTLPAIELPGKCWTGTLPFTTENLEIVK